MFWAINYFLLVYCLFTCFGVSVYVCVYVLYMGSPTIQPDLRVYIGRWPWTSNPFASASQVLRLQTCIIKPGFTAEILSVLFKEEWFESNY